MESGLDSGGDRPWTVIDVLRWTSGHFARLEIPSPRLDAEVLLAHALGCDRVRLYLDHDRPLEPDERSKYRHLVRRRAAGEPAAYLIGEKEFYGRSFKVDKRVLVPRPETEHLVDAALKVLRSGSSGSSPVVLDLCTGSGCIASSLAVSEPDIFVVAVDLCADACELARHNAERLGVSDRVDVLEGDLFEPIRSSGLGPFQLIVANPPYVATGDFMELMRDVRDHEPRAALDSGPTGLEILLRIIAEAPEHAVPVAHVILEHGEGQGPRLVEAALAGGRYGQVEDSRDHAGLDRMLVARTL